MEHARDVYRRGIAARCSGAASVWQGFGALEASVGNREAAREVRACVHVSFAGGAAEF